MLRFWSIITCSLALVACDAAGPKFKSTDITGAEYGKTFELQDTSGRVRHLEDFRGKAVVLFFGFTHCPDVCPIIVGNLHTAQAQLGPEADKLQIIAVSVDPRGDTPSTVKAFLQDHRMTGRMEYLIGSRPELETVWRDWSILSKATPTPLPDRRCRSRRMRRRCAGGARDAASAAGRDESEF